MPAIFGAAGTFYDSGSTPTAHPVAVPAGVVAGSIIVIPLFVDGNIVISAYPSGFAEAPDSPQFTTLGAHGLHVVWKRATGSDTGTYDFTTLTGSYVNARAFRYDAALDSGSPWDDTAGASDETSGTVTPAVSLTTTGSNRLLIWSGSNWSGGTWTPPSAGGTWTERLDQTPGIHTLADFLQVATGSSGSITGTCTGNDRRCAWAGALLGTEGAAPTSQPRPRLVVFFPRRRPGMLPLVRKTRPSEIISGILTGALSGLIGQWVGTVEVSGSLSGTLPALGGQMAGTVQAEGSWIGTLTPLSAQLSGDVEIVTRRALMLIVPEQSRRRLREVNESILLEFPIEIPAEPSGALAATLPSLMGSWAGTATISGGWAGALSALTGQMAGTGQAEGGLSGTLPAVTADVDGSATASGVLGGVLPSLAGTMAGTVFTGDSLLVGVLSPLTGSLSGQITVSGGLGGTLTALTGALVGEVTASGVVNGQLSGLVGALGGTIVLPVGPLAGILAPLSATWIGTSAAIELGRLQGVLPVLVGGWPVQSREEWELWMQRRNTRWFILADPVDVALVPQQELRLPSGGLSRASLPARPMQTFRLIPMSHTEDPVPSSTTAASGSAGVQRRHDFTLLGAWDSMMSIHDEWEDDDGHRYVVDTLVPYNGYERKALIVKYVELS